MLILKEFTLRDLIEHFKEIYDVSENVLKEDILDFINELICANLIARR